MPNQDLEALYPELTRSGRLADALQSSLEVLGSRLKVQDPLGATYATVRAGNRSCQAMLASEKRSFGVDFWDRGVQYGHLWSSDLNNLASALEHFLTQRCTILDLQRHWPRITIPEAARAHENGRLVDYAWSQYLDTNGHTWPETILAEVFIAAARTPLRSLMPFTSHSRACFSTRTGYPYTHDCPMIEVLRTGACHVFAPGALDGASPIFSGSVDDAVTNAVATLPSSISVVRDGTADDDAA